MKSIIKIIFISIIPCLYSCTKVIDIKLRDTDIKYVVEGVITNEPGVCKVLISQTKNFNDDNQFNAISGAMVTISDNGTVVPLKETKPGNYETIDINGIPGHMYELSVTIGNQHFTASCSMPQPVWMDSLYISRGPFGKFNFAYIKYSDPAGIDNGYRFVQYVNGKQEPTIYWANDEFTDGMSTTRQLDITTDDEDDPRNIQSGDTVTVEMFCLDDSVVKYWYSLRSDGGDGSGSTAAPANPVTNIKGGALGYFSAHTVDRRTVIAP